MFLKGVVLGREVVIVMGVDRFEFFGYRGSIVGRGIACLVGGLVSLRNFFGGVIIHFDFVGVFTLY